MKKELTLLTLEEIKKLTEIKKLKKKQNEIFTKIYSLIANDS